MQGAPRTLSNTSSLAVFRLAVDKGAKYPSVRSALLENDLDVFLQWLNKDFAALAKNRLNTAKSNRIAGEFITLVQGQQRMIAACGGRDLISRKQRDDHGLACQNNAVRQIIPILSPTRHTAASRFSCTSDHHNTCSPEWFQGDIRARHFCP